MDELNIGSRWKTAVNGLNRRSTWSTTVRAMRFIFTRVRRLRGLWWRPPTRPRVGRRDRCELARHNQARAGRHREKMLHTCIRLSLLRLNWFLLEPNPAY